MPKLLIRLRHVSLVTLNLLMGLLNPRFIVVVLHGTFAILRSPNVHQYIQEMHSRVLSSPLSALYSHSTDPCVIYNRISICHYRWGIPFLERPCRTHQIRPSQPQGT